MAGDKLSKEAGLERGHGFDSGLGVRVDVSKGFHVRVTYLLASLLTYLRACLLTCLLSRLHTHLLTYSLTRVDVSEGFHPSKSPLRWLKG